MDSDNIPIVKSDDDVMRKDEKVTRDYEAKFVEVLDRISKSARANNRYRVVMLFVSVFALFSIFATTYLSIR